MRQNFKLLVGASAILFAVTVSQAQNIVTSGPGWKSAQYQNMVIEATVGNLVHDQKISGTNCGVSFSGQAVQVPAQGLADPWVDAELLTLEGKINGNVIAKPLLWLIRPGSSYGAQFASTYFADGSTVNLTVVVSYRLRSLYGNYTTITVETPALSVIPYNYGTCLGITEFEGPNTDPLGHGVSIAATALRSMNHTTFECLGGMTNQVLQQEIPKATVAYIGTHGDTFPQLYTDSGSWLTYSGVRSIIEGSTSHVPYNFVQLDACVTASVDVNTDDEADGQDDGSIPSAGSLNHGFSNYGFLYEGGTCVDRSQLGWRVLLNNSWVSTFNATFWSSVTAQKTIHEARDDAMNAVFNSPYFNSNWSLIPTDYAAVFGDYFTRLYGVYTGSDEVSYYGWYRPI